MSSAVLNPERNYNWPPAPAPANLTREIWNTVFASVGGRLASLEAVATGIEQIQNELQQFGLARLDEAIVPLIKQVREELAKLDADVATAKQSNAASVVEFEAAVKAARAEIDVLLAGGLSADKVRETVNRLFLTADERAEIAKSKTLNAAMSEAGRYLVGLPTADGMFDAIKQVATEAKLGAVWLANQTSVMDPASMFDAVTPAMLEYWRIQKGLDGDWATKVHLLPAPFLPLVLQAGVLRIDLAGYRTFSIDVSSNITNVEFANVPQTAGTVFWVLSCSMKGAYTITWPATVKWAGGVAPAHTTTAGAVNTFVFYTLDGGKKIMGFYSGGSR